MAKLHSNLSDESDHDYITTATHLRILTQFTITKWMKSTLLTTMWDNTDGCANQYRFASDIYLLSCIAL